MGWRLLGDDRYTCVPPPGYEKDPAVTAAIHTFDPGVIPFWRIQLWDHDGRIERVVHHGIARHYPYPRHLRRHIPFDMPAVPGTEVPNFLDAVLEDQSTMQYLRGGPGGYVPWDWALYAWCRRKFEVITIRAYMKRHERRMAREAAIRRSWEEDLEYRKKQIEPYLLRQAERVSPSEWAQLQHRQRDLDVKRRIEKRSMAQRAAGAVRIVVPRSPRGTDTYGRVAPGQEMEP